MRGITNVPPELSSSQHADQTLPRPSSSEQATPNTASPVARTAAELRCPHCQASYRPGALACPECGLGFPSAGKTKKLFDTQESRAPKTGPVGQALTEEERPIVFEINGVPLTLPIQPVVVVGRLSEVPGDPAPHVDLNPYGARDLGVSRLHLKITRVRDLIYVMDLDSSNGTYLNGRRLAHHCPRILRNADELLLGHLKVTLRFT
jgi:FHA domain